jgi:hypothetical protein
MNELHREVQRVDKTRMEYIKRIGARLVARGLPRDKEGQHRQPNSMVDTNGDQFYVLGNTWTRFGDWTAEYEERRVQVNKLFEDWEAAQDEDTKRVCEGIRSAQLSASRKMILLGAMQVMQGPYSRCILFGDIRMILKTWAHGGVIDLQVGDRTGFT